MISEGSVEVSWTGLCVIFPSEFAFSALFLFRSSAKSSPLHPTPFFKKKKRFCLSGSQGTPPEHHRCICGACPGREWSKPGTCRPDTPRKVEFVEFHFFFFFIQWSLSGVSCESFTHMMCRCNVLSTFEQAIQATSQATIKPTNHPFFKSSVWSTHCLTHQHTNKRFN